MKYSKDLYELKLGLCFFKEYLESMKNSADDIKSFTKDIKYCDKEIERQYATLVNSADAIGQCSHPLWYLVDIDKEFGVKSYHCKCLKCGKEKSGNRNAFQHVVGFNSLNDGNYDSMKEIFNNTYREEEKVPTRRLMLEKYKVM